MSKNQDLFLRAQKTIPGGVNSPVRAFRSVGGTPRFFTRGEGAYAWDADGKRYIDYVGSWGPLVLGHAHPQVQEAVQVAVSRGLTFGAPTEPRWRWPSLLTQLLPGHGHGASGLFRHRGDHERHPPGARLHRTRRHRQVRGLLPRPRRQPAGQGRLRRAHLRQPFLRRRAGRLCQAHPGARLQRRAAARRHLRQDRQPDCRGDRRAGGRQHEPDRRRSRNSCKPCVACVHSTARC
jgi:hypothetical protein